MKILLTGATGFIGAAFLRQALGRGHEVAAWMRPGKHAPPWATQDGRLTWVQGTLEVPPWREIEAFAPECCVHAAWITTPGIYLEAPENQQYLEWSLGLMRRLGELGTHHMLVLGTCIEYQPSHRPLTEDQSPLAPNTTYARCKHALHEALSQAAAEGGWSLCWGRVFYPYGIGEHPARLCSSLIAQLTQNRKIVLKTPGSTKDYIYVDDLAEAMLTVVEKKRQGPVNLGTGVGVTVREIARTLAGLMNKPGTIEEAEPPVSDPLSHVVADAAQLRELGWRPQHTLRDGLQKLIAARLNRMQLEHD